MKITKTISVFFLFILFSLSVSGQHSVENSFNLSRNIKLQGTSETKEISLNISSNTQHIIFNVSCELLTNELSIKIIDPNGKKVGDFSIENYVKFNKKEKEAINTRKYQETVTGSINKTIMAITGEWKIIIEPKQEVFAEIRINTKQILN